jgi:hypothetical protein
MLYTHIVHRQFLQAGKKVALYPMKQLCLIGRPLETDEEANARMLRTMAKEALRDKTIAWTHYAVETRQYEVGMMMWVTLFQGDYLDDCLEHVAVRLAAKKRLDCSLDEPALLPCVEIHRSVNCETSSRQQCLASMQELAESALSCRFGAWQSFTLDYAERGVSTFTVSLRLFIN